MECCPEAAMPGTVPHGTIITTGSQTGQYVNSHRMQGWGPITLGVNCGKDPLL